MKTRVHGFTLVETLVSVTLAVLFIGAGSTAFLYLLKSESIASVQAELDVAVRRAGERLKSRMRLSGLNEMVFYPQSPIGNPAAHLSIGFPLPGMTNGIIDLDAQGRVIWHETVIIHPWPPDREAAQSLRMTTFSPRDPSLTDAQRFAQIERVTLDGDALNPLTPNYTNATTVTIFENLFNWGIRPLEALYDGYATQRRRDRNVTLGSVVIGPGQNEITFTVTGTDPTSSGFNVLLDTLRLTPSYLPREAEALSVIDYQGPQPERVYEANAIYSANHQLRFPATEADQSFTLSFENDCWEKLTFRDLGDLHRQTDMIFDDTATPRRYALKLAGMTRNWEAKTQSGTNNPAISNLNLHNHAVRVLLRGHDMLDSGFASLHSAGCRIRFQAPNTRWWWLWWHSQGLRIDEAYIAESADHVNPSPDIDSTTQTQLTFNNGNPSVALNYDSSLSGPLIAESDVTALNIDPNKSYVVSFSITRTGEHQQTRAHVWLSPNATASTYRYPGGGTAALSLADWSTLEDADGNPVITASPHVYLVESLFSTYAPEGIFESQIADTRMPAPPFHDLEWDAVIPANTSLGLKIRSGNQPNLSDAPAWSNVVAEATSPSMLANLDSKRYVQFQVHMSANADGTVSPSFERLKLTWDGPEQIVDIGGAFTQSPDGGRFEVRVNNQSLKTGVIVDLNLYRDIRGFITRGTEAQRLNSGIVAEVTPRNTRWDPDDD